MTDKKHEAERTLPDRPDPWPHEVEEEPGQPGEKERRPPRPSYDELQHPREQVGRHIK